MTAAIAVSVIEREMSHGDEIRASLYTSIDVIRVCAMSCGYGETVYISPTLDIIDKITEAIQKVQKRRRRQR